MEPRLTQAAAWLAGQYWGISPVWADGEWQLLNGDVVISVTRTCSGYGFFSLSLVLLMWLSGREAPVRQWISWIPAVTLACLILAPTFNAVRILIASEAFQIGRLFLPTPWLPRLHLLAGVITFLPALLLMFVATRWRLCHDRITP